MTVTEDARHEGPALRSLTWKDAVQSVLGLLVAGVLIAVVLPTVLETSWAEIGAQLSQVRVLPALAMALLLVGGLFSYTWVLTGSLPGLTHVQGLKANAVSSLVANLLPFGAAVGFATHFLMYRSWGFRGRAISSALLVTGLWNLLARVALPVLGCLVLVAGPVDAPTIVVRGAFLAGAVGTAVLLVAGLMVFSDTVAGRVVTVVERVSGWLGRGTRLRRVEHLVTDQRRRVESVVRAGGWEMTLGMTGQFVMLFGLYWFAARAVGLDLPVAELLAAYAFRQLLTAVAVTPGGLGITEVGTAGLLVLLGGSPGAASATALLYAIYAHLLVVPFGLAALLAWWLGPGRASRGADAPRGGARARS
ncbi:lysylphosphatidylglycerol synthase transmembrane domain-containing protein [Ornithinimicrobium cerasi]|uniref:Uncharacterized membrane protein YbhN, UPF0104 family n=1 Tax=Ornithinimicrobium cerasi TaxID=2248773 RepID=A0A285VNL9_9MICO|nr:lysylphosphatidylglycerol synthase transmembrane domain-containing protein [Ornithinimicrobium cerasi]SOC55553.1 Uncharacterized membrane protein YbhN, UPF0104 family [Ornithinimicrobium cerasi]